MADVNKIVYWHYEHAKDRTVIWRSTRFCQRDGQHQRREGERGTLLTLFFPLIAYQQYKSYRARP